MLRAGDSNLTDGLYLSLGLPVSILLLLEVVQRTALDLEVTLLPGLYLTPLFLEEALHTCDGVVKENTSGCLQSTHCTAHYTHETRLPHEHTTVDA